MPGAIPNEKQLLQSAEKKTGLSDWGEFAFQDGLAAMLRSLNDQAALNQLGRFAVHTRISRMLCNRLLARKELSSNAEILQIPVKSPVFILGMFRSGTTFLHRLLAQDPACRFLPFWELSQPVPSGKEDKRRAEAVQVVRALFARAPEVRRYHSFDADSPEECDYLLEQSFMCDHTFIQYHIPDHLEWVRSADLKRRVEAYEYYKQLLQLLLHYRGGSHLVLKSPGHVFNLDALLEVFPDARIVHIHRNPADVIPSLCNLMVSLRQAWTDSIDNRMIGEDVIQFLADGMERSIRTRKSLQAKVLDVRYSDLVRGPIEMVKSIYGHFGMEFSGGFHERLREWLDLQAAERAAERAAGGPAGALEEFSLSRATIEKRFAPYYEFCKGIGIDFSERKAGGA